MDKNRTTKKQPKSYVLSELEQWLEAYEAWYKKVTEPKTEGDTGENPPPPPPPPPGNP